MLTFFGYWNLAAEILEKEKKWKAIASDKNVFASNYVQFYLPLLYPLVFILLTKAIFCLSYVPFFHTFFFQSLIHIRK